MSNNCQNIIFLVTPGGEQSTRIAHLKDSNGVSLGHGVFIWLLRFFLYPIQNIVGIK